MSEPTSKRETAGEALEMRSVVVRGDDGCVYKLRGAPTSERGLNVWPAKAGEEVYVIWGVVHYIRLDGPMQITPSRKGPDGRTEFALIPSLKRATTPTPSRGMNSART